MKRTLLVTCAALLALSQQIAVADTSLPKESRWAWIYTSALFDKWHSVTGGATVTVEGTTFTAKLFDADDPTIVSISLSGTIKGDQIRVRAVRHETDDSPANFSGKIMTLFFKGFADYSGVQTIVLTDQVQRQIGLTRTLRR
jgi:hypothetical protein